MKIIRVFPRKTNATPDDENVRFREPGLFDEADEVHVSVTFTWDKQKAEDLALLWSAVTKNIKIGGPAYDDHGDEFEPGMYIKHGYTMTSRGCPNNCWFCSVPKREGGIRELIIKDGYNVLDSNLLACSENHIKNVFDMLERQKEKPKFTGGLEAKLMKPWIAERLYKLQPSTAYFAYDTPDDYDPLVNAVNLLNSAGEYNKNRIYFCYVLCGYKGDSLSKAELRMNQVMALGLVPMAMLYDSGKHVENISEWKKFQRIFANKTIISSKFIEFAKKHQ